MKEKKPSPISDKNVIDIQYIMAKLKVEMEKIQAACKHDYEILDSWDGHDGWSQVDCEIMNWVHCKICDKSTSIKTGTFRSY